MKRKNIIFVLLIVLAGLLYVNNYSAEENASSPEIAQGIDGEDGLDGFPTLVATSEVAPGANCQYGGYLLEMGVDLNSNGTLDADEVTSQTLICNGVDGKSVSDQVHPEAGKKTSKGTVEAPNESSHAKGASAPARENSGAAGPNH